MGVDPVTTIVGLGIVVAGAYALYLEEIERERRRREEDSRRWRREARKREKEARARERERKEQARIEREREEEERERREWERRSRRNILSNTISDYNYRINSASEYYSLQPYYYGFERESFVSPYDRYSPDNSREVRSRTENSCECPRCQPVNSNPFEIKKNSVSITFTPPQTAQDKNQNAKNQGSNNGPSSNSQDATTSNSSGNASKQNTNSASKASSSGSQQPQRNNNNNNNNKKETDQDTKLNDFIKKLKAILDRCNASAELREKILSFFNKFKKHEEHFLGLLEAFRIQRIAIEDILSIAIKLFQLDYFAKDVVYENFIALMEIVAKYIKDEVFSLIVEESLRGNNKPFDEQRAECMKKVLQRNNILTEVSDLFEKIRKEIVQDNTNQPLDPDFSGIFTKLYHYFKHKDVRGQEWTVTEYFDWIRKLLILLKGLNPEYEELTNVNHTRREIVFEVYSTVFQGRLRIVVRAYGSRLQICTFFFKDRYDKKAKDGDKYVDGKKKP